MALLLGKVIIRADIRLITGTRIGGSQGGLKIGGLDLAVITDPLGRPYLPGSSIKGKLRSLTERALGVAIGKGSHCCEKKEDYQKCVVCRIYGTTESFEPEVSTLTRLLVRDVALDTSSITSEMRANLELEYSEVKVETAIDRLTGTAKGGSLRQVERVPAGAIFRPAEFIFNIFEESDKDLLGHLFAAMALLEHDYLGGMGSRGYGRVAIENISVWWNPVESYRSGDYELKSERQINDDKTTTPAALVKNFEALKQKMN